MVDLVLAKREQILRLARRHGVTRVRVFGWMARGDGLDELFRVRVLEEAVPL